MTFPRMLLFTAEGPRSVDDRDVIALYRGGRFSYDEAQFRAFYMQSLRRLIDGIKALA